ncbi:hypothetical protein [Shimia sp. SK013]|uniref:hypothetical protein n=1 Tax=Shimia sp. SK013 TaxID=1389006 RepID=UPI00128F9D39|nr:hypothetical protein [Shimia sp. SK013]
MLQFQFFFDKFSAARIKQPYIVMVNLALTARSEFNLAELPGRAVSHAAPTLGLLKFTEDKQLPHPGFVVLDSPLLAYEKPEDDADDLSETDVNLRFLQSLTTWTSTQTIILEIRKSVPSEFSESEGITRFTKSTTQGRNGFFLAEEFQ